jgi:hypothetical protein
LSGRACLSGKQAGRQGENSHYCITHIRGSPGS